MASLMEETMEFNHISVLLKECIEGLNIDPQGIYVDGTLGGAGHGYEVCSRLSESLSVSIRTRMPLWHRRSGSVNLETKLQS